MKTLFAATVVASAMAVSAAAQPTLSNEVTGEYNVDSEVMTVTWTPEVGYTLSNIDFTLSSDIAVYNDDVVLGDVKPTLDFGASYMLQDNLEVYGEVSYDLETEARSDVVVGATFSF